MSAALYVIANEYLALAEKLSVLDLDADTIRDTIEGSGIVDSLQDKAQGIEFIASEAVKYNTLIDMEIDRLKALKADREKVAAGLHKYLLENMERAGISKIDCPLFSISIRRNPPAVKVDPLMLPAEWWKTPDPKPPAPQPDKVAIKAAIQVGIDIPGARMVQGQRLEIR